MHRGAGDEDRAFERIGALAAELVGDRGEKPVLRRDRHLSGIEQSEAAGAVGRLHHAGREAGLPDRRRLLVAGQPGMGIGPPNRSGYVVPKSPAQSRISGSSAAGTPNSSQKVRVPAARADVEQQRARGVGGVGRVHLAAGQPPEQEAVDRAEGEPPALRRRARALDVVEQPGDLRRGEIGIEQQPGTRRDRG